jgi:hypothetical protein
MKKYAVTYQKARIMVPCKTNPRTGKCDACGRKVGHEIKVTQRHHWIYQFKTSTVKKSPQLALKNSNEFCFYPCHKTGDALRNLCEMDPRYHPIMVKVASLMPKYMRDRFTALCKLWLKNNGVIIKNAD